MKLKKVTYIQYSKYSLEIFNLPWTQSTARQIFLSK